VRTMKVSSVPRFRRILKPFLVVTVVGRRGVFVGGAFRRCGTNDGICGTNPHPHLKAKPLSVGLLRTSRRRATPIAG
jgi:hypothetical protein